MAAEESAFGEVKGSIGVEAGALCIMLAAVAEAIGIVTPGASVDVAEVGEMLVEGG